MRLGRSAARGLAWAAVAGQVAFTASWIVAGALDPSYSHIDQGVSELGADDAANPGIVNAGFIVLGLSIAALGPAVLAVLPRRRARSVAAALFVAAGAALALTAVFPLDCGMAVNERCRDLWEAGALSWQHDAHLWTGLAFDLLFLATPFALARALWPGPVAAAAICAGAFGIVFWAGTFGLSGAEGVAEGLVSRVGFGVIHLWVLIVAAGLLHETRRERPAGELVSLRPRDFFARAWSGEGELVLRPFFLGRRFPQRFHARRQSTWISERVWRFDDEADFRDGRVQRRRRFCEFVTDDRVRVTAGDLPDGADVWLEEGGLRFSPFRVAFPLGPLPVLVRCYDLSRVEPDGTFVNVIDVRSVILDVPIARVTFRVRPEEGELALGGERRLVEGAA